MAETFDVIVIGAGVHGASTAFHLAERGAKTLVLERSAAASGATGRTRRTAWSVRRLRQPGRTGRRVTGCSRRGR